MSEFLNKYFNFDENRNAFCQIFNENKGKICEQKINCAKSSNMRRHIDRNHKKEAQELKYKDEELESKKRKAEYYKVHQNTKHFCNDPEQLKITSFYPSTTLSVEISREEFKQGMIEMVVFGGAPLKMFSGTGFQRISGELAKKLEVPTSPDSIRDMIIKFAEEKKEELRRILTKKMVFIQIDACTRHQRNFLGINVQFEEKERIITKTLAVIDTEGKHSASDIKKIVHECLKEFNISVENVLSTSVDNAKNMIKAAKELKTNENTAESINDEPTFDKKDREESDSADSNDENDSYDGDNAILKSTEDEWHWINETNKSLDVMRCVIHTLQLALADGLKSRYSSNFLAKIRNIVKKLRTVSVLATIRKKYSVIPIMDNETRWGSKYKMVQRLLLLRNFCEDLAAANSDYYLSPSVWEELKNFEDLLAKPYAVTIKLQKQDITPGEFMKQWCILKYDLERNGGKIAMDILQSMKTREKMLIENHLLLAAIYVDPRYRILLPEPVEESKEKAKIALKRVVLQLLKLKNEGVEIEQLKEVQASVNEASFDLLEDTDESDDEYEKLLDMQEKSQKITEVQVTGNTQFESRFMEACKKIENIPRLMKNVSPFEAIALYPTDIQEACRIVTALPISQVAVERLFSALKYIYNDLRSNMKEDLLDAILFLRMNK